MLSSQEHSGVELAQQVGQQCRSDDLAVNYDTSPDIELSRGCFHEAGFCYGDPSKAAISFSIRMTGHGETADSNGASKTDMDESLAEIWRMIESCRICIENSCKLLAEKSAYGGVRHTPTERVAEVAPHRLGSA